MQKLSIYILFVFFAVLSCKNRKVTAVVQEPVSKVSDTIFASIERSPCFGRCPAFKVVIYKNGFATYEGRSGVQRLGMHHGQFTNEQLQQLSQKAMAEKIDTLKNEYINPHLVDFPSHHFSVTINGNRKSVYIMETEPPANIIIFETFFENIIEQINWQKQMPDKD